METGHYHEWATLFKVLARVHSVLEHIIPPTDTTELTAYNATKAANLPLWKRLDAVVLQWIYATVSHDILTSILVADDVAEKAWNRVAQLFQDNKHSRAAYLETEFTTTKIADFGSVMVYYNRLKSLTDQLANVGSPVSD
ncbi:uncharacterized protein LOC132043267 [Lycium ferocissimum]|uniref:uncharacterized protein LOC132043267 n=1 Tax=Lycium ferocissimum TaxID=112874 RepID=UPI002815E5A9|nr:uncharacterized protein LOC132043267 [Lycium ferocissimum]